MVEMARGCLKEMKLRLKLWGDAIRHAIYLLNKLPTRALSGKTSYEAWIDKKQDIGHVRIFGCLAHMRVPRVQTSKLDDRSIKTGNLGKEPRTKAYRLYNLEKNRVCLSRGVVFEEDKGWMWNAQGRENNDVDTFIVPEIAREREENAQDSEGDMFSGRNFHSSTPAQTPRTTEIGRENYDNREPPRRFRAVTNIYSNTEPMEIDDKLYLMGVDEPATNRL